MCRNQHRESRKVDKGLCSKQKNKKKIQKLIFIKKEISDLSDKYFKIKVQRVLRPYGRQHARPPCPSPTPGVYSNSCPLSQWCHPAISSSVIPFSSRLQSFPASGSFAVSQFFPSGGQSIRALASVSVLPVNVQNWFPSGWTGWISLQSKGLSRVFSNTTVQKHQFFRTQPSLWSNSHTIHDYWKNHSFDYMDLCWQSNVSAF